jgi:O-antigen/teichoic acid export membrane protein
MPDKEIRQLLMSFSAYAYLSKLASTMSQHGDKLIIGAIGGPVAVTLYTVPLTLAGRVLSTTSRLASVMFPHVSTLAATGRLQEMRPTYLSAFRHITYLNFFACAAMVLSGDVFLSRWVGIEFVALGYPVLVLMASAIFADSLTNIPSLVNDALGHPRISGLFALLRGISGLILVYIGTKFFGIVGAAYAHLLAATLLASAFIFYVHGRTVPISLMETLLAVGQPLAIAFVVLGGLLILKWQLPADVLVTSAVTLIGLIALAVVGFTKVLRSSDRNNLLAFVRKKIGR